jgi:hypothetical protein
VMAARANSDVNFPIERGASARLERPPPGELFAPAHTEDLAPGFRRAATTTAVDPCAAYCGGNNPHYTI